MLDAYCNTLSDEAQVKIALRLGQTALPIWDDYFNNNPEAINQVNALIGPSNRIKGAAEKIDAGFVGRALEKIERSYSAAKEKTLRNPVPLMKGDATLTPMLVTSMQPLTNAEWENTLTPSVRLVFTLVFNMLTWILLRRVTNNFETHIYVAINMGADALLRESKKTPEELNLMFREYSQEKRSDSEDEEWERAFRAGEQEPMNEEDIFRRIMGEPVHKDLCGLELASEVLRQMQHEGKTYWNLMDEYLTGTSTTYSFNKTENSFWRNETDVIVGSFNNGIPMTRNEMLLIMARQMRGDLRKSGFEI